MRLLLKRMRQEPEPSTAGTTLCAKKNKDTYTQRTAQMCHSQFFFCFFFNSCFFFKGDSNGVYACVLMASLGNKNFAALYWFCSFFYKIFWNFMSYEIQMPGKCWPTYMFLAYVWCSCFQILVIPPLMLQECIFCAIKNTRLFVIVNGVACWSLWPGGTTGGLDTTF